MIYNEILKCKVKKSVLLKKVSSFFKFNSLESKASYNKNLFDLFFNVQYY